MKKIISFFILVFLFFISCNTSNDNFINELINEKEKEIKIKYSFNKAVDIMVRERSESLKIYFDKLIEGNKNYYDSITSYCNDINDKYSISCMAKFNTNYSKHKNELKLLHYRILCNTVDYYNEWLFIADGIQAHVDYNKNLKVGDTLNAKIYLAITNQYDQYSVVIDKDTLRGLFPTYKKCFNKPGFFSVNGNIFYNKRNTVQNFQFKLNVNVEK